MSKQFLKSILLFLCSVTGVVDGFAQKPTDAKAMVGKQRQALIDSMLQELPKQKEDTNKVTLLNGLAFTYWSVNAETGILYGQQGLALAAKLQWKKGIADAENKLGIDYQTVSDYPRALEYYTDALKKEEEIGNEKGIASVTGHIGLLYYCQNDNSKALEYHFKALKMQEKLGNKQAIAITTSNIGLSYYELHDYDKALEYDFKALKMAEERADKSNIAVVNSNIGTVYTMQKNYTMAIEYEQKALKADEELGDKHGALINLCNIGECFISIINDTAALNGTISEKPSPNGNQPDKVTFSPEMGLKKYKPTGAIPAGKAALLRSAIDYTQRAIVIAKEIHAMDVLVECYENLAEAYRLSGDYRQALECEKNYTAIKDSVFSNGNSEKIVKMSMQNDYVRKRLADSMETANARRMEALKLHQQRNYTYTGLAVIALLCVFTFFIIRNNKLITKEKQRSEGLLKRSDDLLLNILPAEVADELKEKGTAATRYFDNVTVLFTDFVNFTNAGARMSPQALIDELHTCFKTFDEITSKYGIEKIKTIGDAYLAVAGLPSADPLHAEQIVRAAIEINAFMQDRVAKLGNSTFDIRIGIHSGSVVAGIVGVKKFAYDIWGDTVNTAARMEQNSEAGRINISQTTYELVKDKFACAYRGETDAKGKGLLKMYFING